VMPQLRPVRPRGGCLGVKGSRGITSFSTSAGSIASDRFSLLALRRRSVALWFVAIGGFSLAISYVVPVAATLAAAPETIKPLRQLSATPLRSEERRVGK